MALSIALCILWILPSNADLWARVRSASWLRSVDATYLDHVGERERTVSATRSWTDRLVEYHGGAQLDARIREARAGGSIALMSNDYGLAFQTAHRLGRGVILLCCLPLPTNSTGGSL